MRNCFHKFHLQWNSFVVRHHSIRRQNPQHNVGKIIGSHLELCMERQISLI